MNDSEIFNPAYDYDFFIDNHLFNKGLYLHFIILSIDDTQGLNQMQTNILGMSFVNLFVDEDGFGIPDEDTEVRLQRCI